MGFDNRYETSMSMTDTWPNTQVGSKHDSRL